MAGGRQRRPTSGVSSVTQRCLRSRVISVHGNSGELVHCLSCACSRHSRCSHSSHARASRQSLSSSQRSVHKCLHQKSHSPSRNSEAPAWANDILKALEDKMQQGKVVREQLASLKRKSSEMEPKFKYKTNKKQYKFNNEVKEKFDQILEKAGANDVIAKIANGGMSLIDFRNKLISIADRDGWDVVEFFESDPLTKNDEEEKKV